VTHQVVLSTTAAKDLRNLPADVQQRISDRLKELEWRALAVSKKLKNAHRLRSSRVGSYRIVFEFSDLPADEVVVVYRILHRKDAYRDL